MEKYAVLPVRQSNSVNLDSGDWICPPYKYLIRKCTYFHQDKHLFRGVEHLRNEIIVEGEDKIIYAEFVFDALKDAENFVKSTGIPYEMPDNS